MLTTHGSRSDDATQFAQESPIPIGEAKCSGKALVRRSIINVEKFQLADRLRIYVVASNRRLPRCLQPEFAVMHNAALVSGLAGDQWAH